MSCASPTIGSMQKWADEVGDHSYLWQNILPFYEKSTNVSIPDPSKRYQNSTVVVNSSSLLPPGGPLHVSWPNFVNILYTFGNVLTRAAGLPVNRDAMLGGSIVGGAWVPGTINPTNAHRSSSQTSFLDKAIDTTSLKIYIQTLATRVIFKNNTTTSIAPSSPPSSTLACPPSTPLVFTSAFAWQLINGNLINIFIKNIIC